MATRVVVETTGVEWLYTEWQGKRKEELEGGRNDVNERDDVSGHSLSRADWTACCMLAASMRFPSVFG